jgi:hypothetical protein
MTGRAPPNKRLVLTVRRASQARHGAPQHSRKPLGGRGVPGVNSICGSALVSPVNGASSRR